MTRVLLDFSWLFYKSKYALVDLTYEVGGVKYATGSIVGIFETISGIIEYYKSNIDIVLCLDGVPVKQMMINKGYKGARNKTAARSDAVDLDRLDIAHNLLLIPQVNIVYSTEMEADDTIAFITGIKDNNDDTCIIYSSDGDLRQLIDSKNKIYCASEFLPEQGFVLEDEDFLHKNGPKGLESLSPEAVPLYLAITGDTSDTIKGIYRFKKALAKTIANNCITIDGLKRFLNSTETHASKNKKDFITLKSELKLVENNYKLTKLDPIRIPNFYNRIPDSYEGIQYFEKYGCMKVAEGIKKMMI